MFAEIIIQLIKWIVIQIFVQLVIQLAINIISFFFRRNYSMKKVSDEKNNTSTFIFKIKSLNKKLNN